MPLERTPFATAQDFATFARRALSAADTATVEDRIAGVSAAIRRDCGWHIWPERVDDEIVVEGTGSYLLVVPTLYLTAVDSVVEDPAGDATALEATSWRSSRAGMLRRLDGIWLGEFYEYALTITHGHPDNPDAPAGGSAAPEDIRDLVCAAVGRTFVSPTGTIRESSGGVSITHAQTGAAQSGGVAFLASEVDALAHYRIF